MPIPLLAQRCQVAIKAETVPGLAETLTDDDVILTTDRPTWEPDVEVTPRNALTRSLDPRGAVIGARAAKITFKMYLRGTESEPADPLNLPDFTRPFRAAGFVASVFTGVTTYNLTSPAVVASPGAYFTVGVYIDGKLYKIHGAVCDLTYTAEVGKPQMIECAFTGVYNPPIDFALLNPSYTTVVEPPFLGATLTILGFGDVKLKTLTLKLGNEVTLRPDPNSEEGYFTAQITARTLRGSFDPEETLAAENDWFAQWIAQQTGSIDTGIFPDLGDPFNQFQLVMGNVQYMGVKLGDRNGIVTAPIDFEARAITDAGDDAVVFTQQ